MRASGKRDGISREGYAFGVRVLVVEDYGPLRGALVQALREEGHSVDLAADGEAALARASGGEYDVVVLDLMLPRLGGLEVLERLRETGVESHVLILTALDGLDDRVRGLDLGADDYLVKPFAMAELLARVRALVRRGYGKKRPVITVGHLAVHTGPHEVYVDGERVELTAREYALLEYLALRAGEVVSRLDIWQHVYDEHASAQSNVVDVYIGYLRRKLERPGRPKLIHTRRGEGYVLAARENEGEPGARS